MIRTNNFVSITQKGLALSLAFLFIVALGLPTAAQRRTTISRQTTDDLPLSQPLARTDARAQLSLEWQGVPSLPYPVNAVAGVASEAVINEAAEYNVTTATVTAIHTDAPILAYRTEAFDAPKQWPGSIGPDANANNMRTIQAQTESIIGADNRVRITNTTAFPWRTMTKVFLTFPKGSRYVASGILIGAKYVLTAGHVVYSASDGGWARSIEVVPGLNGTYMPYGSAYATNMRTYAGWTNYTDSDYDIALVTLNRTIGTAPAGWAMRTIRR